jgi:hypothetical protein
MNSLLSDHPGFVSSLKHSRFLPTNNYGPFVCDAKLSFFGDFACPGVRHGRRAVYKRRDIRVSVAVSGEQLGVTRLAYVGQPVTKRHSLPV